MIRRALGAAVATALVWSVANVAGAAPVARPGTNTVEIVADDPAELAAAADLVAASGGTVVSDTAGALLVDVDDATRTALDDTIAADVRDPQPVDIRPDSISTIRSDLGQIPEFGPTVGAAVSVTNADDWHAAGLVGTGQRIGVIDYFDTVYWNPVEHGPIPVANLNARCVHRGGDCSAGFFDRKDLGGENHGVAVVEIVRDMAPGAEIFIGQATTVSDYYQLVDWFASKGVRVITRSLGSRYDGPGDGRGDMDSVANHAVSKGILWVNSGGNNATNRYYRHAVRLVGDKVAFGASGSSTRLRFNGCVSLGGVRWANDWDKQPGDRTDYDVSIWDGNTLVADSKTRQQQGKNGAPPVEHIAGRLCPSAGNHLFIEIALVAAGDGTAGDVIEILDYGDGMSAHTQAAYSASTSIVASKSSAVIGVGAVDPVDSGRIGYYSSQGPTNDGRVAPAISAPSGFASTIFGPFSGTSAAAPVVAGGAALLRAAGPAVTPTALGNLARASVVDRGASGPDHVFGHGEFRLPAPPTGGTADQIPSKFVAAAAPTRILDTRRSSPIGPAGLIGDVRVGQTRTLPIAGRHGVPRSGVTAVAVNITTARSTQAGYVQAIPTGRAALGSYSNLNLDQAQQTRANFAVIPLGDNGNISLYSVAGGNLVVDLLGWFTVAPGPVTDGRFVGLPTAARLHDSRAAGSGGALRSGTSRTIAIPRNLDRGSIRAAVVTVTSTQATSQGWIQAFPPGANRIVGASSTVNLGPGEVVANTAIVPVVNGRIALAGSFVGGGRAHIVVDMTGYITSTAAAASSAGRYVPAVPGRAFDSRNSGGQLRDAQIVSVDASAAPRVQIPDSATAVMWNLTAVRMDRRGWVRGWPAAGAEPATSSANWSRRGEVRATASVIAVDQGRSRFRLDDGAVNLPQPIGHFLTDVFGYFT